MNTYKTLRGIQFDLDIIEVGLKSIVVQATCEQGINTFTIRFPFEIKEDNAFYGELLEGDTSQLTDEDLEEAMAWVDEVTIAFVTSEAAKVCLMKSNKDEFWSFSIYTHEAFKLDIFQMKVLQPSGFEIMESLFAYNETEIKELISKLK